MHLNATPTSSETKRDVEYGHKVNLATQAEGFFTYLNINEDNPVKTSLFLPVLDACEEKH